MSLLATLQLLLSCTELASLTVNAGMENTALKYTWLSAASPRVSCKATGAVQCDISR